MKLTRVRIDQFRQFRQPVEITGFDPGLNLFTGPNEAGKSTIVAAIRAAFFERHRSSSVDDFRPRGDSAAAPTVEVEFDVAGGHHRLTKTFLSRKRCELDAAGQRLDGADAEDHLARLLGFQHASRGASSAGDWGIPGLLWIQQGSTQDVAAPVAHATGHLRTALNQSLGEVASSGGDDMVAQVEAARDELLTEATGKPKGVYAKALQAHADTTAALGVCATDVAQYRTRVDTLATLRAEHAADDAERPWAAFRVLEQEAVQREDAVRRDDAALTADRRRASELDRQVNLLRDQVTAFAAQDTESETRRLQADAAHVAYDTAASTRQHWQQALRDATARSDAAREQLRAARAEDHRRARQRERIDLQSRLDECTATLAVAEREHEALQAARRDAAGTALPPTELKLLRDEQRALRDLRIQQSAAATGLRFSLDDGRSVTIADESVHGDGERELIDTTTLRLPGLGMLTITPGGTGLADLRRREQALADEHAARLARIGAASLDAAEARHAAHLLHVAAVGTAEATLRALAPKGIDAVRAERAALADRAAALAPAPDAEATQAPTVASVQSVSEAEVAEEAARQSRAQVEAEARRADLAAGQAQAAVDAAVHEHATVRRLLDAPDRAQRVTAASHALADAIAERQALSTRIDAAAAQIAQARPDLLAQDVLRYRRSAEQHEKRFGERREALLRLEVELQAAGAQGLDERHAELVRDQAQQGRRVAELRRRADALDHLLGRLRARRRALTRQLQAPLQHHLQRYLTLLFPQATLEIDENLMPGALTRPGPRGPEAGLLDSLSFGAREQMGLLSRLAYADLLKEAGRPTLLILDDALVHTDDERLAQMKRVLFDAATRHQILVFSCHPAKWRDLGVAARAIGVTGTSS